MSEDGVLQCQAHNRAITTLASGYDIAVEGSLIWIADLNCGIAKYGYWESLHLFSSLSIICLAQAIKDTPDASVTQQLSANPETTLLYQEAKMVLSDMATSGNPAASDFQDMLLQIENLVAKPATSSPYDIDQVELFPDLLDLGQWDALDDQMWSNVLSGHE